MTIGGVPVSTGMPTFGSRVVAPKATKKMGKPATANDNNGDRAAALAA
jgi:hypothetical protein